MPLTDGPISLLVVDDEEPIRNALKKFLTQQGYDVTTAASGDEAMKVLQRQKIACMLLDVRMPGRSGIDLVPQVMELEPSMAILMLTAVNDATTAALCMQRGAMDYLTKPIDLSDLARAILRAIRRRDSMLEQQHLNQWLKEEVAVRTAELRRERAKLERLSVATLEALVNALEAKAPYIRGHSARVADRGALIAAELGQNGAGGQARRRTLECEVHAPRGRRRLASVGARRAGSRLENSGALRWGADETLAQRDWSDA